jgi:hypothetical protein
VAMIYPMGRSGKQGFLPGTEVAAVGNITHLFMHEHA